MVTTVWLIKREFTVQYYDYASVNIPQGKDNQKASIRSKTILEESDTMASLADKQGLILASLTLLSGALSIKGSLTITSFMWPHHHFYVGSRSSGNGRKDNPTYERILLSMSFLDLFGYLGVASLLDAKRNVWAAFGWH